MASEIRVTFRMPEGVHAFLAAEAAENFTSLNAEIVRSVRERMERARPTTGQSFQAPPAAGPTDAALPGGAITHG